MKTYRKWKDRYGAKKTTLAVAVFFTIVALLSCGSQKELPTILGAGATFPFPAYAQMFVEYEKVTGAKVNYQSIGSGGGIKQINEETVDFGATDAFMSDEALLTLRAEGKEIIHFPTMLGAVTIVYNVDGVPQGLQLTGLQVSQIFSGKITRWDDPSLAENNPEVSFPSSDIIVVRRSDGSGTTDALTRFLSFSDPEWTRDFGVGKSIEWFEGTVGSKGNEGVAASINNTPGSIGYLSLNYVLETGLNYAAVQNVTGRYILPSLESISAAGNISNLPRDTRFNIPERGIMGGGYPISSLTWIVVYKEQSYNGRTAEQATALKELLDWMFTDGQQYLEDLHYSPIPNAIVNLNQENLEQLTFDGTAL